MGGSCAVEPIDCQSFPRMKIPAIFVVVLTLLCGSPHSSLFAQNPNVARRFLADQRALWTSPLKIKPRDVKWLAPIGVGAGALLATDWRVSDAIRRSQGLRPPSNLVSKFGGGLQMTAASASVWALGKVTHSEKATQTGKLAVEAVLHTELIVEGLKLIASRERPNKIGGHGAFRGGGQSFPSGHTATTFAFATVVAHKYKDKPLAGVGVYGLATVVGLSRVGGLKHFPSDALIGATIGHLIGRYIIRRHD